MPKYHNATKLKKSHLVKHKLHQLRKNEYFKVLVLRTIGNFLILSSIFMIAKTFYLPAKEEIRYFVERQIKKEYYISAKKVKPEEAKGLLARAFNIKKVEFLTPEDPDFSIIIPKIGANAKILANVDSADENTYLPALQKGVAHALGTAFPGESGHIFLFAHSTDYFWNVGTYNAIFYLLHKLEIGDEVNLIYKGQRFLYRIIGKTVVNPSEVEYLTRKTEKEFLTLQTCWPPGTTLKRLLIFATRVSQ